MMEVTALRGRARAARAGLGARSRDTSRYADWVAGTDAVTRTDGPARQGSTYDEVNPILGPWKAKSSGRSRSSSRRVARCTAAPDCRSRRSST